MPTVLVKYKNGDNIQEVECNIGQNLFQCFEEKGIKLPHGCLAGSCGSCKVEILEGMENISTAGVVEQDTLDTIKRDSPNLHHLRLSCRAKINGPVSFQIPT